MEAEVLSLDGNQTADHEAGADQEHHGEGDFADDETAEKQALAGAADIAAPGFAERCEDVAAGELERWGDAEEHGGGDGDAEREEQHRQVESDLGFVWNGIGRHHGDDATQRRSANGDAEEAADHGQQQALGE